MVAFMAGIDVDVAKSDRERPAKSHTSSVGKYLQQWLPPHARRAWHAQRAHQGRYVPLPLIFIMVAEDHLPHFSVAFQRQDVRYELMKFVLRIIVVESI